MIDLGMFFKVHFSSKRISDFNLKIFVENHIERLKTNNKQNKYDTLIDYVEDVFKNYCNAINDEDVHQRQQVTVTQKVNALLKRFKETISEKEVLINLKFGKSSQQYVEFFPLGVTEYIKANKSNVDKFMESFIRTATRNIDEVGQNFIDTFTSIRNEYNQNRTHQLQLKDLVSKKKTISAEKRRMLEIQLQKNLLLIAAEYICNPEQGMIFFDQNIIQGKKRNSKIRKEIEKNYIYTEIEK